MDNKLLRALMGTCSTAIWCFTSGQWSAEQALQQILGTLQKVATELDIDLSSESQLQRLRDEAVTFRDESIAGE